MTMSWVEAFGRADEVDGTLRWGIVADGPTGPVPALLHAPSAAAPMPVVLLGHGGGGAKDDAGWQAVARFLAVEVPAAVLCIDGPFQGERSPRDGPDRDRRIRRALADPATATNLAGDWRAALDRLAGVRDLRDGDLGYFGYSMGTMLGVPVCADLPVRAAVFAAGGVFGDDVMRFVDEPDPALAEIEAQQFRTRSALVLEAAARLADVDVLQLCMSRDDVFPMTGALELFAAFPGPKRLVAWDGRHIEMPHEALDLAAWFLRRTLNGHGSNLSRTIGAF
ncbi:MAG TPA: hypothetical protein VHN98_07795 [Acidimicrobiales bacterium]|nr:hypothetical protein [Acidimicrobiales bacterium]